MKTKTIIFNDTNDIMDFLINARLLDSDVVVKKGKWCVDGKSLLGMMYMGGRSKLIVEYSEKEEEFDSYLNKYV